MGVPRKARRVLCERCKLPCEEEIFEINRKGLVDGVTARKKLCSIECLMEVFENELFLDKVDDRIRKEMSFLHKHVCPACIKRLRTLE
jgi:hypothetical protein